MNVLDEFANWLGVEPTKEPALVKVGDYDVKDLTDAMKLKLAEVKLAEYQEKSEPEPEEQFITVTDPPVDRPKEEAQAAIHPTEPHERFAFFHAQLGYQGRGTHADIDREAFKLAVRPVVEFLDWLIDLERHDVPSDPVTIQDIIRQAKHVRG